MTILVHKPDKVGISTTVTMVHQGGKYIKTYKPNPMEG